ncbi:MAG: HlyD family type I secretion periplasmic adaptor subunit [Hyphomicrobiaceae bacterium]
MKQIEHQTHLAADGGELRTPSRSVFGPAVLGLAVLVVAFAGLGGWGALVPLSSAVVAQGEVIVNTRRKEVQHLTGGTIKSILTKDGTKVRAGDVLMELDPKKLRGQLDLARNAYFANRLAKTRILAERDEQTKLAFSPALMEKGLRDRDIGSLMMAQKQLFRTKRDALVGQRVLLEQRISQLGHEIEGLGAEKLSVTEQLRLAAHELLTLEKLHEKGHVTRHRLLAFKREIIRLRGSNGGLISKIAKLRKEAGSVKLQILQLTKQRNQETAAELRDTEIRLLDSHERYLAAKAELAQLKILAPVTGTVVGSRKHTIGGVVRPGETILEIVPAADKLIVEARIRPLDIDNILPGQETSVRLTALRQRSMTQLSGRVVYVSADRSEDSRSGETYYLAQVEITPKAMSQLKTQDLVPGMPAEIFIKNGERTALAYLMDPLMDGVRRAWREQ